MLTTPVLILVICLIKCKELIKTHTDAVETCDSLLMFSSEQLNLGLEQEVIDVEGDVGDSENEDLNGEQENLARDKLCGL
jgi:hypothetical protein